MHKFSDVSSLAKRLHIIFHQLSVIHVVHVIATKASSNVNHTRGQISCL